MSYTTQDEPTRCEAKPLSAKFEAALGHLAQARAYAVDVGRDPWEFAVEIQTLTAMGLTTSDLRWLVSKRYIEHAYEVTRKDDASRSFKPANNLVFRQTTCFVLGEPAGRVSAVGRAAAKTAAAVEPDLLLNCDGVLFSPAWDPRQRTLRMGPLVVKRFRFAAPNQEAVLAAFEEEGWPPCIYDPLPGMANMDAKQRLHDTIKFLNRNQENPLITFRGDGNGERVLWEPAEGLAAPAERERAAA